MPITHMHIEPITTQHLRSSILLFITLSKFGKSGFRANGDTILRTLTYRLRASHTSAQQKNSANNRGPERGQENERARERQREREQKERERERETVRDRDR